MDPAPIWPDLKTFPWAAFRDRVDILTGGYPCQPFSAAGKRLGGEDPRHLWPHISRGISILQPRVCFFENVEGHITCGLHHVLCDLGRLGYRTTWGIFSASECGAPHQRKRVFILAVASGFRGTPGLSGPFPRHEGVAGIADNGGGEGCCKLGDSSSEGHARPAWSSSECPQRQPIGYTSKSNGSIWPSRPGQPQYGCEPPRVVANGQRTGWSTERVIGHLGGAQSEEGSAGHQPASPTANCGGAGAKAQAGPAGEELGDTGCERQEERQVEAGGSEQSDQDLADTSILGSDGRSDGSSGRSWKPGEVSVDAAGCGGQGNGMRQTQPPLGGDPNGPSSGLDYAQLCVTCDNRTDELRLLGNGVVPHTAELAFRVLIQELANE